DLWSRPRWHVDRRSQRRERLARLIIHGEVSTQNTQTYGTIKRYCDCMVSSGRRLRLNRSAVVNPLAGDHVDLKIQVRRAGRVLQELLRVVNVDPKERTRRHYDLHS